MALPLEGIRVIDSSWVWAIPHATSIFGDMGADVIRVEACNRLDTRAGGTFPDNQPDEEYWNHGGTFCVLNHSKRSLTVNLQKPQGPELFRELVKVSDIVAENNRPGVMARFGLDYQSLRAIKPDLIMLSNTGYGQTGPWREYGAIALGMEPTTGISALTGYPGDPPTRSGTPFTDFPVCWTGVFATLAALYHRRKTGVGQHVDLAMYQVGASMIAEYIMDYTANGRVSPRIGNGHPYYAPHGCYPCTGEDNWITIAVTSDVEWQALCQAMGQPGLADDPRFADGLSRLSHLEELDTLLSAWTAGKDRFALMDRLQRAGIAAGAVNTPKDAFLDPQLNEHGFWERVVHDDPVLGKKIYSGRAWKLSRTPGRISRPTPRMGEHNQEILTEVLGLSAREIEALEREGVIGTRPADEGYQPSVQSVEAQQALGRIREYDPNYKQALGLV